MEGRNSPTGRARLWNAEYLLKFAKGELRSPREGFRSLISFRLLLRACQTVCEKQTKICFTRGIGCEP
ncbi:hypothetical protein Taro_055604 [Colocasia esculenta]|uniref:Uncharacterized protein n=1 Tax=Colocasia esculenta TaxID=4460 RepID=A0A843XU25_COLES|nr:hypothetical protein [Colocasia esculenta]